MQAPMNGRHPHGALVIDPTLAPPMSSYVNPSQIVSQSSQSVSPDSEFLPSPIRGKPPANAKRKRTDTPEDTSDPSVHQHKNRDKPRKKKATRACFHCQKAHLTCDDSRPCQRCIKRGISGSCTEGHRKKAKYLLDDHELEELKKNKSSASAPETVPEPPPIPTCEPYPTADNLYDVSLDARFISEGFNSEYSMMSSIIGMHTADTPPSQLQYASTVTDTPWPASTLTQHAFPDSVQMGDEKTSPYGALSIQSPDPALGTSTLSPNYLTSFPQTHPYTHSNPSLGPQLQYNAQYSLPGHLHLQPRYHNAPDLHRNSSGTIISPSLSHHSPSSTSSGLPAGTPRLSPPQYHEYVSPHSYMEGYHNIMKHLQNRFDKNDTLRIVRALAIYRPSLIALQMPLSQDDESLAERCFQRSLPELEQLIALSGTPTVVWRRTGEICLVAPEFCLLTEWPMEEVKSKRIYELFENQSVVEYFENFAQHAFENSTRSINSHCILLKPSGGPIPCTFCFSVRRDLFDLPSHVIGQWLPLM